MKIAVIGLYYASNLGDAVICDCVMAWMKQSFPDAQIDMIDIEGHEEFPPQTGMPVGKIKLRQMKSGVERWLTKMHIVDMMYVWNEKDVRARQFFYDQVAAQNYDIAVFAGGQLFMDWLSVDVSEFVKRFEEAGTRVFFNACGTGPALSRRIQSILRENLSKDAVKLVSSRDNVEEINRLYLTESKKAVETFDPALWSGSVYGYLKKEKGPVGLGVMHCIHIPHEKVETFWVEVIRELNQRNIDWRMFCNGDIEDYNLGLRVLKRLGLSENDRMLKYPDVPEKLVEQIAGFSALISFRLHSHIIAVSLDIPAVAIEWDEKLRFFYRNIRHEERCLSINEKAEDIADALQKACEEGYDRVLIDTQKEYAKETLLSAIRQVVSDEQRERTY